MEMDMSSLDSIDHLLHDTDPIPFTIGYERINVLDVFDEEESASKRQKIMKLVFLITSNEFNEPIKQILPKTLKDKSDIWQEIKSWSHSLFRRAFRMTHVMFEDLIAKIINIFPGRQNQGYHNYMNAVRYGKCY
jgi:thioredoxin-related protein